MNRRFLWLTKNWVKKVQYDWHLYICRWRRHYNKQLQPITNQMRAKTKKTIKVYSNLTRRTVLTLTLLAQLLTSQQPVRTQDSPSLAKTPPNATVNTTQYILEREFALSFFHIQSLFHFQENCYIRQKHWCLPVLENAIFLKFSHITTSQPLLLNNPWAQLTHSKSTKLASLEATLVQNSAHRVSDLLV